MKLSPCAVAVWSVLSPPARGRGLKPHQSAHGIPVGASPPARGRGLKPGARFASDMTFSRPPHGGVD